VISNGKIVSIIEELTPEVFIKKYTDTAAAGTINNRNMATATVMLTIVSYAYVGLCVFFLFYLLRLNNFTKYFS
jgi:hypothetical protein